MLSVVPVAHNILQPDTSHQNIVCNFHEALLPSNILEEIFQHFKFISFFDIFFLSVMGSFKFSLPIKHSFLSKSCLILWSITNDISMLCSLIIIMNLALKPLEFFSHSIESIEKIWLDSMFPMSWRRLSQYQKIIRVCKKSCNTSNVTMMLIKFFKRTWIPYQMKWFEDILVPKCWVLWMLSPPKKYKIQPTLFLFTKWSIIKNYIQHSPHVCSSFKRPRLFEDFVITEVELLLPFLALHTWQCMWFLACYCRCGYELSLQHLFYHFILPPKSWYFTR